MNKRTIFDQQRYVHFITFTCYGNRCHLNRDDAKRRLLGKLNQELKRHHAHCSGFVIMPDHVHLLIWFDETGQLSRFMQDLKRSSSRSIKLFLTSQDEYADTFSLQDPIWKKRYYSFEIETEKKLSEKLKYIHMNPVKKGLGENVLDWPWTSARYYELQKSVGIPIDWPE